MHTGLKKHLFIYLFLFAAVSGYGQQMEGKIRYLIVQNWTKQMAAVDYISKQRRERIDYMWGNRSEWKQYGTLYFSPTRTKYEDSEERAEADDQGYSWRRDAYTIQRDFATNMQHDVIQMLGKIYLVDDTLAAPDWKIMNDMKEVAGHVCMNAYREDTLKKQKIFVWFALDMPVSAGPERLGGLPGLILEADVNDGAMLITADKIEMQKLTTELEAPKKLKGKKINEAAYADLIRQHMEQKRKEEEPYFWGMRY